MRFAVISDVQGNLPALRAVLDEIGANFQNIERIVSAGDIVGRGPFPNEVLDIFREQGIASVRGNYDDAVAFNRIGSGNDFASRSEEEADEHALAWTRNKLTDANLMYLRSLPMDMRLMRSGGSMKIERNTGDERTKEYKRTFFLRALFGGLARTPPPVNKRILVVHGSPRALNEFVRGDTANSILGVIARDAEADVVISGHAGVGFVRDAANTVFIGVGRVDPPAGAEPRAEFAVVDVAKEVQVHFGTARFDSGSYRRALNDSGLPLATGT